LVESVRVFELFNEICAIPHGSGNMEKISRYCLEFAEKNGLQSYRDEAYNVILYKKGSAGYEDTEPVILQGHLDMVCQKTEDCKIDFLKDGITSYVDGDFIKAKGTTLGADNGIAVAMIMAILESDTVIHPPIEAVFTVDEEVGMLGAMALDCERLSAKKMINLDAGGPDVLTVSCAGGINMTMSKAYMPETVKGHKVKITLQGLAGGHSGVEIHKGRVNANVLMGRILNHAMQQHAFAICSLCGGDKDNVITNHCEAELATADGEALQKTLESYLLTVKEEISEREPDFEATVVVEREDAYKVIPKSDGQALIQALACAPSGVLEMSAAIEGLVETSINPGVLKVDEQSSSLTFSMRSNKNTALMALLEKMESYANAFGYEHESYGYYLPWEFNSQSVMQGLYTQAYRNFYGSEPQVRAIHAGLECGVFASKIKNIDCIAIGPQTYDVHSVDERLSISSTQECFVLLQNVLKACTL